MKIDKNTLIGLILMGLIIIGIFYINGRDRKAYEAANKRQQDSIALDQAKKDSLKKLNPAPTTPVDTTVKVKDTALNTKQKEELIAVETDLFTITFSTLGGQPKKVALKNYKKVDSSLVVLQNGAFNNLYYEFNIPTGGSTYSKDVSFTAQPVLENSDGSKTIKFVATAANNSQIVHEYIVSKNNYMVDCNVVINGIAQAVKNPAEFQLYWNTEMDAAEKDVKFEKQQTQVCYLNNSDYNFETITKKNKSLSFGNSLNWIAGKQQFFIAALLNKKSFSKGNITWTTPEADTAKQLMQLKADLAYPLTASETSATIPLQLYYGPSDYDLLKKYHNGMQKIVPYGSGIFAFVKYINRYFLLPIFDFLKGHIASMGLVIVLLTFIIRLITAPIMYKSYVSSSKMKILKPDLDKLKQQYTNPKTGELDQQQYSVAQMQFYREAGVSPLGGCVPALLQIPIFMSLFYFFQSNIDFRNQPFLWATNLAMYDSILDLPFNIPFYGDHVSLFTILATLTSLAISLFGMNQMQGDQNNPVMKYMPYIFPILLLGVFNNLPSALTWYYTVSNSITLLLQIFIQKVVIDHDKLAAKIELARKTPKKESKFAERMKQMQDNARKMQEQRNNQNARGGNINQKKK